jgi:hypothetical protein
LIEPTALHAAGFNSEENSTVTTKDADAKLHKVEDWSNAQPTSHETTGMYAGLTTHGSYGETDPVYDFWEQ